MKYLMIFIALFAFNANATLMTAKQARRNTDRELEKEKSMCVSGWETNIDEYVNDTVNKGECSLQMSIPSCISKKYLYNTMRKLRKLGYRTSNNENSLFVGWCNK